MSATAVHKDMFFQETIFFAFSFDRTGAHSA